MDFFLLGVIVGILIHKVYIYIKFIVWEKEIEEKFNETLNNIKRKIVIPSKIESVDGNYLMYNRETNEFLGQANSIDELGKIMQIKYPNKLFDVSAEELTKIMKEKING